MGTPVITCASAGLNREHGSIYQPWAIVVESHYCRKTADTGVGVTELELPAFEDELLHETTSTENTNAAKGKTFFIKASVINSRL